ncbi:proteasome assembly chaperone family protein [Halogeometricum borinquense]|uniref:Proteasome assembly chaperone family protein n=1 Tax=Halogeometricum borinquense TaxID=60847 RepID=A0A6C0UDV3_9EURY|nr:proteasome assembly chaperone family protein [Halogeometricum borinquense]QIB73327.1 proteasome assembly chaperone family protein [Halogeometricum borinquense]QIQ77275.1 proteasome assembly chaperone family protein [Halogeometricum borinquense]
MEDIEVETLADPDLRDPVLVEGLPGVGHVGKLAVEHLLEELDSEPVRYIYADEFPPQVTLNDDSVAQLARAEFHAVDAGDRDLLVLTGDHQAQTNSGHYHLTDAFLDIAEEFGVEEGYALGGVPTGELVDEPSVLGAVTDEDDVERLEAVDVEFREDEPAGGIVGVSGLLLGLGERRGLSVACLMGETSGYLVDPQSAQVVLEVLQDVIDFEVGFESLEERAEEMKEVVGKIQEMQSQQQGMSDDDLRYIG